MNLEKARLVLADIEANKDKYNQFFYHMNPDIEEIKFTLEFDPAVNYCKTQHCVAGFAQLRGLGRDQFGLSQNEVLAFQNDAAEDAQKYLELTRHERYHLFSDIRTWEEVRSVLSTGVFPAYVLARNALEQEENATQ